ncbi:DUF6702 family protein [Winogradskyella immobilis]|uniref:Peptidase E n=1 Tax=Winogradskyella immobilis TaxID=2816852 RepID=A0ABS8EL68_9FLAO|nr:DUF6702 family protein [Winogradskyella immobilis]MCC1483948.1 peptidase E [Winogradskyella immobilis]MCG0016040.1 peptidase E [Winogradskyella immobilis]
MKLKYIIVLLLAFPMLTATTVHKYYVSVTKIEYVKEKKSVQIISQIFIDDFEKLLRERYDESIELATGKEPKELDDYIERYLKGKFKLKINAKNIDYKYLGKEYKEDIVYCYLEIENISEVKTIEITNDLLFDVFEEQQNIVRTEINGKKKSFLLIPQNNIGVLNFD